MARWGGSRRSTALLVLFLAGCLAGAAYFALQAWVRIRVDTPVLAEALGKPGCVTTALFTAPNGTRHEVDLRVYKGLCRGGKDPGDPVEVWYLASDPSVNAPDRSWGWYAVATSGLVAVTVWIAMSARRSALAPEGAQPARPEPSRVRPPSKVEASRSVPIITAENRHLYADWTDGRLELLIERTHEERAQPAVARATGASDRSLEAVATGLAAVREALAQGAGDAQERFAVVARAIGDEWAHDAPLGRDILSLGWYVEGVERNS